MSIVVETHQDPRMELYRHTPRNYRGRNIRAGGVILHLITLLSPLSRIAGMDQITKRLSCLDQWLVLQIQLMNPNPNTHGDMGWGFGFAEVLPQGHDKVISMSQEGQINSK